MSTTEGMTSMAGTPIGTRAQDTATAPKTSATAGPTAAETTRTIRKVNYGNADKSGHQQKQ